MKKMIFTAIVMIAMSGLLSAQTTRPGNGNPGTNKNNPSYVDANKNDVCDNYENGNRSCVRNGQQGQGRRFGNGYGMGNRQGRQFGQCRRGGGRRS